MNQSFINQGNPLEEHLSRIHTKQNQGNWINYLIAFGLGIAVSALANYLINTKSNGIDINDYLNSDQS